VFYLSYNGTDGDDDDDDDNDDDRNQVIHSYTYLGVHVRPSDSNSRWLY